MTVGELIAELGRYPSDYEVRVVEREEEWDSPIYMVESEVYGLDPDRQVGICVN